MAARFHIAAWLLAASGVAQGARLTPQASRAFEKYIASVEAERATRPIRPPANGDFRIEAVHGGAWEVEGGLLHHWRGTALVPGVNAEAMLALLRDYNHLARYYSPEVVFSRALEVNGEDARILMRFRKHKVITVVLDAEFDTHAALSGAGRGSSASRSIHVWEVEDPGSPKERRKPEGHDNGFLWRLNSYWKFEETPRGLLIECEAVSLTRDVPTGLGWLVMPVIKDLPRESLEFTLTATKNVLGKEAKR